LHAGCPVLLGSKWSKCTVILKMFWRISRNSQESRWGKIMEVCIMKRKLEWNRNCL
jgi:hypothetical protein